MPASPAPFSAVFEFTERRGSFVYIVRESHLMRSTIEVEDFDFQGLRDACAHPARAQHPDRVQPSREAAPGSRHPMGPRARAARLQSTGAGALRGLITNDSAPSSPSPGDDEMTTTSVSRRDYCCGASRDSACMPAKRNASDEDGDTPTTHSHFAAPSSTSNDVELRRTTTAKK